MDAGLTFAGRCLLLLRADVCADLFPLHVVNGDDSRETNGAQAVDEARAEAMSLRTELEQMRRN